MGGEERKKKKKSLVASTLDSRVDITSIQQAYNYIVSGIQAAITPNCLPFSYVSENPDSRVVIWRAGGIVKSGSWMYTEFNKSTGTPAHHLFSDGHEVSCPHGIHHPTRPGLQFRRTRTTPLNIYPIPYPSIGEGNRRTRAKQ